MDEIYNGLLTYPGRGYQIIVGTRAEIKYQAEEEGASALWLYTLSSDGTHNHGHYVFDPAEGRMLEVSERRYWEAVRQLRARI